MLVVPAAAVEVVAATPHWKRKFNRGWLNFLLGIFLSISGTKDAICGTTDLVCDTTDLVCGTTDLVCGTTDLVCDTTEPQKVSSYGTIGHLIFLFDNKFWFEGGKQLWRTMQTA